MQPLLHCYWSTRGLLELGHRLRRLCLQHWQAALRWLCRLPIDTGEAPDTIAFNATIGACARAAQVAQAAQAQMASRH